MKTAPNRQKASEASDQQDPSFWRLLKAAKAGLTPAANQLRRHPRVSKMILVICVSLMRDKRPWEYRSIENLQEAVGRHIRREIAHFEGNSAGDFSNWLWKLARTLLEEQARDERLGAWWQGLSDRQRQILNLRAEGLSLAKIGARLPYRKSISQVRWDLMSALKQLESILPRWQDDGSTQKAGKGPMKGGKTTWQRKVKKKPMKKL